MVRCPPWWLSVETGIQRRDDQSSCVEYVHEILPLAEIKVGPKASFPEEKIFLENILDEKGYGSNYEDRPRIIHSSLTK
jgi:hypothetical protein